MVEGPKFPYLRAENRLYIGSGSNMYLQKGGAASKILLHGGGGVESADNFTISGAKTFTTGTGAVTLAGAVACNDHLTLATTKYLKFSNDKSSASGLKGNMMVSGGIKVSSATAWVRCTIGGINGYIPVFSSTSVKHAVGR